MLDLSSSIWNVLWVLGVPGIATAGWVLLTARRKGQWYHFFDAKHNLGFPKDAGDFNPHWKRYEGLAKLCIALSAGAVAFLINLLVNLNSPSSEIGDRVRQAAPLAIGFFAASIFMLILFLLWMTYCYEDYCHSCKHDTYRAWKYALTQALGCMGFIAFLLGFLWLGSSLSGNSGQLHAQASANTAASAPTPLQPAVTKILAPEQRSPGFGSTLDWLSSDRSLAPATWGLVIATFLLFVDGFHKSREQQEQWKQEKQRRILESTPSAVVEIVVKEETPLDMCFACFNLGNNTFYIDKMIVTASDGTRSEAELTPQIVTPGTWVTIDYNPAELLGMFGENTPFKEANCVFLLRGASGVVTTDPEWFYVGYGKGRADWHKGRLADWQPGVISAQAKILRVPKQ